MEESKKDTEKSISFTQLHGLIKLFEKECDKENENSEELSLRGSQEVENGVRSCLPLFETLAYVCKNPFSRQMHFDTSPNGCGASTDGTPGLSDISQSGCKHINSSWKAVDGSRVGLTIDDFFLLEQKMMLKSLERLLRLLVSYGNEKFLRGIKSIFIGASGYEPLNKIYLCAMELFCRTNDSEMRLYLVQIIFLAKVMLNSFSGNDYNEFPKNVIRLFRVMQQTKSRSSLTRPDDEHDILVFLVFTVLSDLLNKRCGIKRAESYINDLNNGNSTLDKWMTTYVISDIIQCYFPATAGGRSGNLFISNVVSFSVLAASLEKLIDKKNKNVQILQTVAYIYLSSELCDLRGRDSDHDTMFGVAYNLACACVRKNPIVKSMFLEGLKSPDSKMERGLLATCTDLSGLRLFSEAKVPPGIMASDYVYLLEKVHTACTQVPLELDNNKMDFLLHFLNAFSESNIIYNALKRDIVPFFDACIDKLEVVLLCGKAGAQCLKDLVALVLKRGTPEQRCVLLDSLLCFNDGSPWVAAAVATLLIKGADVVPDKDLFYKFVHRNLTSAIGSNSSLSEVCVRVEESACVTLELIDALLNNKGTRSFVLAEKDSLTRLLQSILSHSVVSYFMKAKQRKIISLCIKLLNVIQGQKFRTSYVNFVFKVINLASFISSGDNILVSCFEVLERMCKEYHPGADNPPEKLFAPYCSLLQKLISSKMQQLKHVNKDVIIVILRFLVSLQLVSESLLTYKILSYAETPKDSPVLALIISYIEQQNTSMKLDEISYEIIQLMVTLETANEFPSYPWYAQHEDNVIMTLEKKLISSWKSCDTSDSWACGQECLLGFLLVATAQKKAFTTKERLSNLIRYSGKPLEILGDKFSKAAQDSATLVACLFSCADKALFQPKDVSAFLASLCGLLNKVARNLNSVPPESCSAYFYFASQVLSAVYLRKILPLSYKPVKFSNSVLKFLIASDEDFTVSRTGAPSGTPRSVVWDPSFLCFAGAALKYDPDVTMSKEIFMGLAKALMMICHRRGQSKVYSVLRLFLILGDLIMSKENCGVMVDVQVMLFADGTVVDMAMRTLCYLLEDRRDLRSASWVFHFLNSALPHCNNTFFLIAHLINYFDSIVLVFNTIFRVLPRDAASDSDPTLKNIRTQALNLLRNIIAAYNANYHRLQNSSSLSSELYSSDDEMLFKLLSPFAAESGGLAFFHKTCLKDSFERERLADVVLALAQCFPGSSQFKWQLFQYVCGCALNDLHGFWEDSSQDPSAEISVIECARIALLALCEVLPPLEILDSVPDEYFVSDEENGRPTFERMNGFGNYFKMIMDMAVARVVKSGYEYGSDVRSRKLSELTRLLLIAYTVIVAVQVKKIELRTDKIQKHTLRMFKNDVGMTLKSLGDDCDVKKVVSSTIPSSEKDDSFVRIASNLFRKVGMIIIN